MQTVKNKLVILFFLLAAQLFSQEKISLEQCYNLVKTNYPLTKQFQLLNEQEKTDLEVIELEKLPQLDLAAQATYQSHVTQVPLPNSTIEPLNKDQYKATLTINQLIYAGGLVNAKAQLKNSASQKQQQQLQVGLHQLKTQVNRYFFSILLMQEQQNLLQAKENLLRAKLSEMQAAVKYGVALPASDKILEAELLKLKQQFTDNEKTKQLLLTNLGLLAGTTFSTNAVAEAPLVTHTNNLKLNRPELYLYELQKQEIDHSKMVLSKQNAPKLAAFATGGYGNPGLNMLDNSFKSFYMAGLKLNWNVFDWNANKKQQTSLLLNKEIIDNDVEIFKLNTTMQLQQQQTEIEKIEQLIETDLEIEALRKEILNTAESQLKNGVITASAYITELTNLYESQSNTITHKIQLQLAKANYLTIQGY
jgi:outer membrane protein TolC